MPNPLELLTAQAIALHAQSTAILKSAESLLLILDSMQARQIGEEAAGDGAGAPAVPFLMGEVGARRPATAPASPGPIPTPGQNPGVPTGRLRTFDDPPPPAAPASPASADDIRPDGSGDLQPVSST